MQTAPRRLLVNKVISPLLRYIPQRAGYRTDKRDDNVDEKLDSWYSSKNSVHWRPLYSVKWRPLLYGDTHDRHAEDNGLDRKETASEEIHDVADDEKEYVLKPIRRGRQRSPKSQAPGNANEQWRKRLVTFEQYEYESDVEKAQDGAILLIDLDTCSGDWQLWLELIRFRKRHYGAQGTIPLFREIFRRELLMPDITKIGNELWYLLIMAGHQDPEFLKEIIAYGIKVKQATGHTWRSMYKSIVANAMKKDPVSAYEWHVRLKAHYPPTTWVYTQLFHLAIELDCVDAFEGLYRDYPVPDLYTTIVPKLSELQQFQRALRWHHLLFTKKDYPVEFYNIKPLLVHLAKIGDHAQIEQITSDLKGARDLEPSLSNVIETYIRKDKMLSREIFNRHLGEVHGVAPKHFSDSFCARLFATTLFSVDTVISGLQMMAVTKLGPLALREMAIRDEGQGETVLHLNRLEDVGISPDQSAYSLLVQKLASTGNHILLRLLVQSDLHPDNFDNINVQEALLPEYHQRQDHLRFELTLAAITVRCREPDLAKWRWNLILRCHITLRDQDAVIATLEAMKRENVPITARSSRHLRVKWLSGRNVGRAAQSTKELTIIINASMSTLQSGRPVPITAWKEILRRLGMAGRRSEFENLALWLVDYYTSPKAQQFIPDNIVLTPSEGDQSRHHRNPKAFLNSLFTIGAQHAIVAWGFKQEIQHLPAVRRLRLKRPQLSQPPPHWSWGLILLRKLQERGVPIHQDTVARICKTRLKILFGDGTSRLRINRKARWINDQRKRALDKYALGFYVNEIQGIWGRDLFHGPRPSLRGLHSEQRKALP